METDRTKSHERNVCPAAETIRFRLESGQRRDLAACRGGCVVADRIAVAARGEDCVVADPISAGKENNLIRHSRCPLDHANAPNSSGASRSAAASSSGDPARDGKAETD